MTRSPSIVKGHSLRGEPVTTTHIVVVVDEGGEGEILELVGEWVSAGVLEPALWIPASWLDSASETQSDPSGWVFGRGQEADRRTVSILEALAREPHTNVIITILNSLADAHDASLLARINGLIRSVGTARPQERVIENQPLPGTEIRVLNLMFPAGGEGVHGIGERLMRSDLIDVENLVVNPEDRPTPASFDVLPRRGTSRWVPFMVSTTASVTGLWSSLASSPVVPDATWVQGNVRLVRSFARVVLTHPLLVEVAGSTSESLLADRSPLDAPGVILSPAQLAPLGQSVLTKRLDEYAAWLMDYSGLGYREMEPFIPPSRVERGFLEGLRDFSSFAGDRLRALPRWIGETGISAFNLRATNKLYGEDALVSVDVRIDLNRRRDDARLVEAWDLVAQERVRLETILDAPTDPPEESEDPRPWIALHEGVAFFAEGKANDIHDALRTDAGVPQMAARLDDVLPPPDDHFTVDRVCDELLGGDGTGRQVSWMDIDGAERLSNLLQKLASAKRQRLHDLRSAYLKTEADFFSSQERFVDARFRDEDLAAKVLREERIASVDGVHADWAQDAHPQAEDAPEPVMDSDESTGEDPSDDDESEGWDLSDEHDDFGLDDATDHDEGDDDHDADDHEADDHEADDDELHFGGDPFESPLDEIVASSGDLVSLREIAREAEVTAQRERRLRGAMSDVTAYETDRIRQAEEELRVIERTHGELSRWIERRTTSFVGRVLDKVSRTSQSLDHHEREVLDSARQALPDYGPTSVELQRRFVTAVMRGLALTLLIALIAGVLNARAHSPGGIFGFSGVPWWLFVTVLVVVLILVVLGPLISYFQAWTRERVRAQDARAELQYQCNLVSHVRTERLRLAQLYTQMPHRIRALALWWHYWRAKTDSALAGETPTLPSTSALPFHLRWASVNWSRSPIFRRMRDELLSSNVRPGYRSELIEEAADSYEVSSGRGGLLDVAGLARMRSADALAVVSDWVADEETRRRARTSLERRLAQDAQEMNRKPGQDAPHVDLLSVDPLQGMEIETNLVGDMTERDLSMDEFLLEIGGDANEMGYRLWSAGVGVQPFTSLFAGPERLTGRIAQSVSFVHVESSKLCSSEVAVRLDITGQVSAGMLEGAFNFMSADDEEALDESAEDFAEGIASGWASRG